MGEDTKIQWTDHTFNGWVGCEKVSPGCKNCYAAVDTYARVSASRGLPLWGPDSSRHVTSDANWRKPLAWNRAAEREGVRRRVFCSSLCDVFEDRKDLFVPRARLAMLIAETPHLDWLLLTKRPENAARLWDLAWGGGLRPAGARIWLPNVWLGATCEDQPRANERLPHLLAVPAAVRFVSYEPALGPVDFSRWLPSSFRRSDGRWNCDACCNKDRCDEPAHFHRPKCPICRGSGAVERLDWIIVGGESGPGARPFDLSWARSVVRQTREAGVACFVKQLGRRPLDSGGDNPFTPRYVEQSIESMLRHGEYEEEVHDLTLRAAKGGDWSEWPEDLRVRQWPEVRS